MEEKNDFSNIVPFQLSRINRRRILNPIIFALLPILSLRAQNMPFEENFSLPSIQTSAALLSEYISWGFASNATLRSTLVVRQQLNATTLGAFLSTNRDPVFETGGRHYFISTPGGVQIQQQEIKLPPDLYELNNPFAFYIQHHFDDLELFFSTHLFVQTGTTQQVRLIDAGDKVYYISVEPLTSRRSDVLASGRIAYSWARMKIFAGVSRLKLFGWGDDTLQSWQGRPICGLQWPMLGGESQCESNTKEFKFSHSLQLKPVWLPEDQFMQLTAIANANFKTFPYKSLELNAHLSLSRNIEILLGYRKVWNQSTLFSENEFYRWRSSLSDAMERDPSVRIQHTALRMGVAVQIGADYEEFPLRLIGSKIFHQNIYAAKKDYYAYNPIGTIDIHNTSKHTVICQVKLELPEHFGTYKSETLKIEPDEIKNVPLYLYLTEQHLSGQSSPLQLDIAVEVNEKKHILSSVPLTIFDVHSWDGNTWGLRYYLTPDEPTVLTHAKRKYVQSLITDTSMTEPQKKMKQLSNFLTEIGRNLHYVQEPTTSLYVDRVQYPIETMEVQSGDCKGLSVYIATNLMAVGIQCAFVDIKPMVGNIDLPTAGKRQLGHIFLLVDTNIEPEYINELGLKEFQFISRKSAMGKSTIWIPIETTVIDQGFDKAFREGVNQYYEEVIEHDGMNKGSVHVYDF